jgi:membrane-bound lytic murein transglycosylase B
MFVRALAVLLAAVLAVGIAPRSSSAQEGRLGGSDIGIVATNSYGDGDLIEALESAELLQTWVEASEMSVDASLVEVPGETRTALIDELGLIGERLEINARQQAALAQTNQRRAALADVALNLRNLAYAADEAGANNVPAAGLRAARTELVAISALASWRSVRHDVVVLVDSAINDLGRRVSVELDELAASDRSSSLNQIVARLTSLQSEIELLAEALEGAQKDLRTSDALADAERDALAATFAELHRGRSLGASNVSGLTVVTFDAYVSAAQSVDASCPVDWALLAGVGRIESRHGTMDDSSVQRNGKLTRSIFGPLLDGGATEREAAEVAAAEAAEQARIEAEEAAAAAAIEEARRERLFGDQDLGRAAAVEETRAAEAADDAQATDDSTGETDEDSAETQFDPALWGDQSGDRVDPVTTDDADDFDRDPDAEDDIPDLPGNGFAVIEDSDDGRLDGNDRWDRAVGPMQFIPETWSYWGTDGNGDGVVDPQNLYDAATSAARFLCHLSRTRGSAPQSFVLGYNASDTYVRNVLAAADGFRSQSLPTIDQTDG